MSACGIVGEEFYKGESTGYSVTQAYTVFKKSHDTNS